MASTEPVFDFRRNRLLFLTVPATFILGLGGALIAFMVYRRTKVRLEQLSTAINGAPVNADQKILQTYREEWFRMDARAKLAWKHVWVGLFGIPLAFVLNLVGGGGPKPYHEDQSSTTIKPGSYYEQRDKPINTDDLDQREKAANEFMEKYMESQRRGEKPEGQR